MVLVRRFPSAPGLPTTAGAMFQLRWAVMRSVAVWGRPGKRRMCPSRRC